MEPPQSCASDPASRNQLIIALDFPSAHAAMDLVDRLDGHVSWFKVGLQLYVATGPSIVERLRLRGFKVFLDLKLHDIPNTVRGAVDSLCSVGADLLSLHASGGADMLLAAAEAAHRHSSPPKLLGVTVLTSMDDRQLQSIGVQAAVSSQVLCLAGIARAAGMDGMVCSPQEIVALRVHFGSSPLLVVPGIRPTGSLVNDQKRIATPAEALSQGASYLVIGRPITHAPDPATTLDSILKQMDLAIAHASVR